jgi:hypothetical protein
MDIKNMKWQMEQMCPQVEQMQTLPKDKMAKWPPPMPREEPRGNRTSQHAGPDGTVLQSKFL